MRVKGLWDGSGREAGRTKTGRGCMLAIGHIEGSALGIVCVMYGWEGGDQ